MNKTIYIKKTDGPTWDLARKLSNGNLSVVIMKAVKKFVEKKKSRVCHLCGRWGIR